MVRCNCASSRTSSSDACNLRQANTRYRSSFLISIPRCKRQRQKETLTTSTRREEAQTSTSERNNAHIGEEVEYKDSWTDIVFIGLCRKAYGNLADWQSERDWRNGDETYKGMVEVSRALMKGKTAAEQQDAVIAGFPAVPGWFRKLFPYSKWGAEINARITPAFFRWLVGPMERIDAEIDGQTQRSAVHIKRCRYLAESSCAGMCVNLCKSPVQTFFTEELGMPLTMKPNFEDYSCEMVFGERPPSREQDEAYQQSCLEACPKKQSTSGPCRKLR